MNLTRRGLAGAGLALLVLSAAGPTLAGPAHDGFMGTWRLNKARSTIGNDPGVKSKEIDIAPRPGGGLITETLEMQNGDGARQITHYRFTYGRFMTQTEPGVEAFSVTRAGPHRVFWAARKGGKTIARLQVDLSQDSRTLTFRYLFSTADPTGKVTADRYVYERQ